jgi:two-component system, LytTR family, response regulator
MVMEKIRTIIVEDEELARNLLRSYIKDLGEIELLCECENGFEGVKAINELKPDLVFLDIQMPKITGFEMLELLDHHPEIIFCTAYDQFALKAFEFNAADYLLKPFSRDRLMAALEKVKERIEKQPEGEDMVDRITNFPKEEFLDRIVVKDRHKIHIIPADHIRYIESMDDYVLIYTTEGRYTKQKTMRYFEMALDTHNFARIHRSYIVRIDQIAQLQQYEKESYVAILHDKTKLKVSKSGYKNLKDLLNF